MYPLFVLLSAFFHPICAQQMPLNQADVISDPWIAKYGASQPDLSYTGPLSFSHIPYSKCLENPDQSFDLAVLGMPFDTTTSYRPGARFGPAGIRHGSRRQHADGGYTLPWGRNPYTMGAKIIDCGDVILVSRVCCRIC
jgi:agmatinase